MSVATATSPEQSLVLLLRALRMPSIARYHEEVAQMSHTGGQNLNFCIAAESFWTAPNSE